MDYRSQVFCLKERKFTAISLNTIISERKSSFWPFCFISEIYIKFWTVPKNDDSHFYVFTKLRTAKGVIKNCLTSPILEHCSTVDMLKGPKHCWNLHGSTFVIFSHHSERNTVGKCFPRWYLKSWDILLRYWLWMARILL